MPETLTAPTKTPAAPNGGSDSQVLANSQVLAQVEKWMATIQEIRREQQDEIKFRG